jgi:hypothetical protein
MQALLRRATAFVVVLCLGILSVSPAAAAPGGNGNGNGNGGNNGTGGNNNPPSFAATPELDSLALFGTGAAGLAGYALMRLRAARRRPD